MTSEAAASPQSPTLARLLGACARTVGAVRQGRSLTDALSRCPPNLRPGCQALSFCVLRWLGGAMAARKALVPRAPPREVEDLLLCALALLWPEHQAPYPAHTLVDQAVTCARKTVPAQAGMINAVLRRFLREAHTLVPRLQAEDPVARHQHPQWWIEKVRQDWPEDWIELLKAAQVQAPMALRVNARQCDAATYANQLAEIGLHATVAGPHALVLSQPVGVERLPGFAQGRVSVQDLSAQRAAEIVLGLGSDRLPAGARVLDACAAPGGKTAHLLEAADLALTALDVDAERLKRVADTLSRLNLKARLLAANAADVDTWWDGQPFDAILLDAPCSASGIVRRHPDVRWLRRASDIDALVATQKQLLNRLWPLLKPGGRLVYATCSLFKSEGMHQIDSFLQQTPDALPLDSPGHLLPPADNPSLSAPLLVGDGFFYARMDKAAAPPPA